MSAHIFDIDTSPETAELLEIAKNNIRETPENREKGFKELRELLKQNSDLHFREDDDFLTIILRICHWYADGALKLLRRVAEFRKEHEKVFANLNPEAEQKTFTEGNVVNILPERDHKNRRILILNQGKMWNPEIVNTDQIFRVLYIIHIVAQLEIATQVHGVVVLMDYEGLSMTQIKAISTGSTKRLLTFIQDAMVGRLKEIHFVKQPFIFNMVWQLFKPFVKEKLKSRMFFHGDDMKKLHKYIPPEYLPSNYGGTLPEINYTGKDWYPCVSKYLSFINDWQTFGFK